MFVHSKWEPFDPKLDDLYSLKDCVSSILDAILDEGNPSANVAPFSPSSAQSSPSADPSVDTHRLLLGLNRSVTESELQTFVQLRRTVLANDGLEAIEQEKESTRASLDGSCVQGVEEIQQNPVQEKRTLFSLSHDEGSIGNTSDNLEAVSEAASNHSVESSVESENDEAEQDPIDNLSDMVSSNVSGKGSPNVSGQRDKRHSIFSGKQRSYLVFFLI